MTRTALFSLALPGLTALALAGTPAHAAIISNPNPPVDTSFQGSGVDAAYTGGVPGERYLSSTSGTVLQDFSGLSFTADAPTLYYTPSPVVMFFGVQPQGITVTGTNFSGSDSLTAAGGVLNVNLAGTFTGPSGAILGVSGGNLVFTGTATETGGTGIFASANGTLPFALTETVAMAAATAAIPAGFVAPQAALNNATYTASYGALATPSVPEPAPLALLALGLLPVGFLAARRRRA